MIFALVAILATLGKWLYDCNSYGSVLYYSKTAKQTTVTKVDPLFGQTVTETTSEPGNWLGLLDIAFPFGALPICGVWAAVGVTGFIMHKKQRKAIA